MVLAVTASINTLPVLAIGPWPANSSGYGSFGKNAPMAKVPGNPKIAEPAALAAVFIE